MLCTTLFMYFICLIQTAENLSFFSPLKIKKKKSILFRLDAHHFDQLAFNKAKFILESCSQARGEKSCCDLANNDTFLFFFFFNL